MASSVVLQPLVAELSWKIPPGDEVLQQLHAGRDDKLVAYRSAVLLVASQSGMGSFWNWYSYTAIHTYIYIYIHIYMYIYIYICMWIYQGQLISASPTVPSSRPRPFVKAARPAVAGDLGLRQGQAAKLSCRQEKTPDFSHIFGWSHFESLSSFDPYHTLTPFLHPFANRFSSDHPKCDWEVSGTSPIWPSRLLINFYK